MLAARHAGDEHIEQDLVEEWQSRLRLSSALTDVDPPQAATIALTPTLLAGPTSTKLVATSTCFIGTVFTVRGGSSQARWFFGRDELTAELVARLDERLRTGGMQVVVAPSGAGSPRCCTPVC